MVSEMMVGQKEMDLYSGCPCSAAATYHHLPLNNNNNNNNNYYYYYYNNILRKEFRALLREQDQHDSVA